MTALLAMQLDSSLFPAMGVVRGTGRVAAHLYLEGAPLPCHLRPSCAMCSGSLGKEGPLLLERHLEGSLAHHCAYFYFLLLVRSTLSS